MLLKWPLLSAIVLLGLILLGVFVSFKRKEYLRFDPFVSFSKRDLVYAGVFVVFIISTLILAGRPQKVFKYSKQGMYSDIYILLDVSGSMDLTDSSGRSRLTVAKEALIHLLESLPRDRFRVGFIVFAHYPLLQIPLTTDYMVIKERIKLADPDTLPLILEEKSGGTDIAKAIILATIKLANLKPPEYKPDSENKLKPRAIILITDGQQTVNSEYSLEEAAELASKYKIKIYPIIVNEVENKTALAQAEMLALKTDGHFYYVDQSDKFLEVIDDIVKLEKEKVRVPAKKIYVDFPEPLMIVWLLSVLMLLWLKLKLLSL